MDVLACWNEDLEHYVVLYQGQSVFVVGWKLNFILPVQMPDVAFHFFVENFLNLTSYFPFFKGSFALGRENLNCWATVEG